MCWSGLPITKRNSCLNLLKSTTNQCHNAIYFWEKEKTSGNILELQRRGVNKLSGISSRKYKFLQDSVRWGLWQLGAQTGWWMALLTCREVALRKQLWHIRSERNKQLKPSTFQWLSLHVPCFDRHHSTLSFWHDLALLVLSISTEWWSWRYTLLSDKLAQLVALQKNSLQTSRQN